MLDVTVVLLEGGYASTAIGPIEVFHSAGLLWNWLHGDAPQPRFRVRVASIDGRSVTSLCAVGLTPACAIDDIERTDIIILSASGWDVQEQIAQNTGLLPWLRAQHARGAYIGAICTGVAFLAECGLLDGRQATTHWALADLFRERYPKVFWRPEQFVTEDGRLLCSGGVYAALDCSLYLVEKFCGHEIALQCAKALLLPMPRKHQSGYAMLPLSPPHGDTRIRAAEAVLQAGYRDDISTESLARQAGLGLRTFARRFKAATGRLPAAYLQAVRIETAKAMLESETAPIQVVSSAVGYDDVAFFRTLFKRSTGMTPVEYRSHFAPMNVRGDAELAGSRSLRAI